MEPWLYLSTATFYKMSINFHQIIWKGRAWKTVDFVV